MNYFIYRGWDVGQTCSAQGSGNLFMVLICRVPGEVQGFGSWLIAPGLNL